MNGHTRQAPGSEVPPGLGVGPLRGPVGIPYPDEPGHVDEAEAEADAQDRIRWAEAAALAEEHRSDADLRREVEATRARIGADVAELRHRFGIDDEARLRRARAHGPFAPAKRHPFTAAAAESGWPSRRWWPGGSSAAIVRRDRGRAPARLLRKGLPTVESEQSHGRKPSWCGPIKCVRL
ncbi:hypothetical protein GCM10029992_58530 [Glycomyces albus]